MGQEKEGRLADIKVLLQSLDEVEDYIVTDREGRIHVASSDNYDDNMINSCIYLWVVGAQVGTDFKIGEPANLSYYLKTRKILIQKYEEYLIIIYIKKITKFSVFKKRLYDQFSRIL